MIVKKNPVTEINDSLDHFRELLDELHYLKGSDLWSTLDVICEDIGKFMIEIDESWEWE